MKWKTVYSPKLLQYVGINKLRGKDHHKHNTPRTVNIHYERAASEPLVPDDPYTGAYINIYIAPYCMSA